jgi:hypothetical protein
MSERYDHSHMPATFKPITSVRREKWSVEQHDTSPKIDLSGHGTTSVDEGWRYVLQGTATGRPFGGTWVGTIKPNTGVWPEPGTCVGADAIPQRIADTQGWMELIVGADGSTHFTAVSF